MIFLFRLYQGDFCSYFSSTKRSSYYAIEGVSPWVVQSSDCVRNIYRFYFSLSVLHDPNSTTSTLAEAHLDVTRSIFIRSRQRSTTYRLKRSSNVVFFPRGVTSARLHVLGKRIWTKYFLRETYIVFRDTNNSVRELFRTFVRIRKAIWDPFLVSKAGIILKYYSIIFYNLNVTKAQIE